MSTLPVPGGILAQLAPATGQIDPSTLAALLAMKANAGPDTTPGAPVAPAAVQPPTVAANNGPPPPIPGLSDQAPPDHLDAPPVSLPSDIQAPQHHSIFDHGILGQIYSDPNFRAEALRFGIGAMTPGHGGLAGGLQAATQFSDQRHAAAEDARRFNAEMALKGRGVDVQQQEANQQGGHLSRADTNEATRIGNDYTLGSQRVGEEHRGNTLHFQLGVLGNQTQRRGQDIGASTTERGQNLDYSLGTQRLTSDQGIHAADNATSLGVATINAGGKERIKPEEALNGVMGYLPSLVKGFPSDPKAQADAWATLPTQVQTALTSAYINSNGDMNRFGQSAQQIVGQGASYTDDNHPLIPFVGSPEYTQGAPGTAPTGQQGGGKQIVRTGTDKQTGKKVVQYSDGSISYAD